MRGSAFDFVWKLGRSSDWLRYQRDGRVVDVVVTEVVWLQIRREGRYHREKRIMGAKARR
jgi:hypothetical protein